MKYSLFLLVTLAAVGLTGCRTKQQAVVQETYIHKLGCPIAKEDWNRNGKEGQVISLRSDGVTVSKTFNKGVLDGVTTYSFPNSSTLARIENYQQGQLVSKLENYASGISKEEEKYASQMIIERNAWYEDGTPSANEKFENGLIVSGEYRTPFNDVETQVVDGKGVRITRGFDGELLYKDTIEGGQMIERISYFPSGDPSSVTSYKDSLINGTRLTFLHGGLPNTVEEWSNGQQQGITVVYLNGEKVAEVPYLKGKKEGVELRYRDGAVLVEEVTWRNDLQHGPRKIILDENTSKTEWYLNGEIVSKAAFERMNVR